MNRDIAGTLAVSIMITLTAAITAQNPGRVAADPIITNNPDGTSDAVWNFTNPSDYTFTNTEIVDGNVTLERQPTFWWNSTTIADFSGAESTNNVTVTRWPGDVALSASAAPLAQLTIQPGLGGEDTYLDWNSRSVNYGPSTTIIENGGAHPILRFNLSAVPASVVIDSATLSLYQNMGEGNPVTSSAHYVTTRWDENQANWDNRLTGIPWTVGGGDFGSRTADRKIVDNTLGWKSWNVTQMVDLWYRGRLNDLGLILEGPNPGPNCNKVFYSSEYAVNPDLRPKLDIWFRGIGVAGEYVSKIGGPGSPALWKSISWNPQVKDLLSDEFDGSSLDPKWIWTNPPATYDVGVTRPGSLHLVSGIDVDFADEIFTGEILSQNLAGDFTATMKYNVNPTVDGQEAGLMVLVDSRNWYSIGKDNVGGVRTWRARSTDDGVTTGRVNVGSGNPVPAWVRIERSGDKFTASTSTNGVSWTVRDVYTPASPYSMGLRVALYAADGMSGTALTVDVDYMRFTLPDDARITVQTRIGDTTRVDPTWSGWSSPYPTPATSPMSGGSRYVQYRLSFSVGTPGHVPAIGNVNISWFFYPLQGTVETNDLAPASFAGWGNFTVVDNPNGQTISYEYSLDSGGSWTPVVPPSNMQSVSIATGKIRFRAMLSTIDVLVSPSLSEMRLTYTQRVDHFFVAVPQSAVAGAAFSVAVTAKGPMNTTIVAWTGWVTLTAVLQDGMTPGGGTLGATSLLIAAGGTGTLPGETYTKAEIIRILAHSGTTTGLSDNITVSPGPMSRLSVAPDNVTVQAFASQIFTAQAYDALDNEISGINFTWVVFGGVGGLNVSWGRIVLFTANPPAANGTLQASFNAINGTAQIQVTLGTPPWITISNPIPGAALTGVVPINYRNSPDAVSVRFEYNDGTQWRFIGVTSALIGTFYWDTSGLDFSNGILLATVTNSLTATNMTVVAPIEVDNTPPAITIRNVVDNQIGNRTLTIAYTTDPDVVRVDFTYFDGVWHAIGSDSGIDGSYLWIPGSPINGVTLRAVAVDHVGLTGWDSMQGVGNYVAGPAPPSIAPIPDLYVHVSSTYRLNLTFYLTDPDTPLAALSIWDSDPASVVVNPGAFPSLDVTYSTIGTYTVTLWASDGADTAWALIRIISSDQSPPVLVAPLPTVTFDEDTVAFDGFSTPATTFFNDPDGDMLSFQVLDAVNVFSRVDADSKVDFWASLHWHGLEILRLRATDPTGGFAEGAFLVVVRDVNHPPVLVTSFPPVSFDENSIAFDALGGSASAFFNDPDGDPLTITMSGGVNVFSRINPDGTVDVWGATNWSGLETLTVRATDPFGDFAEGPFVVTVIPVNYQPIQILELPNVIFDEDTVALDVFNGPISAYFYDRDGGELDYAIYGETNVYWRVNADLTIDVWARTHWWGQEIPRVVATDVNGSWAEAPFLVTVRHVNHAPILVVGFPSVSFYENSVGTNVFSGDVSIHFFDIDGDPVTFSILGGVQMSSRINPNGTVDLWAPMYWFGSETMSVRATDPSGLYVETTFLATVRFVDQPPMLAPIPDIRIDDGATFTLNLTPYISDIDTPIFRITAATDTQYVTANGTTLTVAYPAGQGETAFTVTISDGVWTASQHVRVSFIHPWWKDIYVVSGIPFIFLLGFLLAAAILIRRKRWRPAKAFVLDGQLQPIREFTLDQRCDVTYDEVVEAGVLDAIDEPVRVREYRAQTLWGNSLAMVLLARGSISQEQIKFATDMLVNIHDRSEDAVVVRLKTAVSEIKEKQMDLSARSKAFAGTLDATNTALSRLAAETAAMQKQRSELDSRDALLKEKEAAMAEDAGKLQQAREMFETRRKEFEELAVRFEEESRRRMDDLNAKGKPSESEHPEHATRRKGSKR